MTTSIPEKRILYLQGPAGFSTTFPMEDDGYGYPDVTGSDGIYTGTLPKFADKPGESDVLIIVLHLT